MTARGTDVVAHIIDGVELVPRRIDLDLALPRFESVEADRLDRKQKLAGALRIFGRLGFGEGVAGHITVRDPEHPELFWVNPIGKSFRRMSVSDLLLIDHHGNVVSGERPVNPAAYVIHSAIYAARPDVMAAAHSHSVHGRAFSSLGLPLAPITQDSCLFYRDHVVVAEQAGAVVLDEKAASELAATFSTGKAAIHRNHGLFTVGRTVDEAAFWFIAMERSCQAQLLAMGAGTPAAIDHAAAEHTRDQNGTPFAGWFSFQPLWEEICHTDPDLFN
jgi:ribulose-5-phosphate 4-epimerase/fuculose-1-phosphate aldolase